MSQQTERTRSPFPILVATFVMTVVALAAWYHMGRQSDAEHYRQHHDADSLWAVLKTDVNNGDSVTVIEQLLGEAPRNNDPRYRNLCERIFAENPEEGPSGFEKTDELLGYKGGKITIHLQFRDGRLINHNPKDYPMEFNVLQ